MLKQKGMGNAVVAMLADERVRRAGHEGATVYTAVDVLGVLVDSRHPDELWSDLKAREPALADRAVAVEMVPIEQAIGTVEMLDLEGVLRLVQSAPSPRAEKLRQWMARAARERIEEAENPELAILRTREAYQQAGRSRQWIDQRMRGVSARHELAGEWYKRGARDGEQFRGLTNRLMETAFGMDVETYRRYKGLWRSSENLRDHMTDLELSLTTLAETAAASFHRDRRTDGFDGLADDVRDAGEVIARTRDELESRGGRAVVFAGNNLAGMTRPRPAAAHETTAGRGTRGRRTRRAHGRDATESRPPAEPNLGPADIPQNAAPDDLAA